MSASNDRKKRDLDLLMKSYKALEAEQNAGGAEPEAAPARRANDGGRDDSGDDDGEVMMYRGRPIRRGSGSIPGAGSSQKKGRQFRGSTGEKKRRGSSTDQLKAALTKLTELHKEGLITQAEYDAKRLQILDRL